MNAHQLPPPLRETINFLSRGTSCEAWLYRPSGDLDALRPVIVMAHGLGAVKEARLDAYAERFVAEGYICLVFDHRFLGGSGGEPRQLVSVARQQEDWTAAIDFALSLAGVDPQLVVAWGTSFGGGNVLALAARDYRLAAAMIQCPFTDGVASVRAMNGATAAKVTMAATIDLYRAARGKSPYHVPLVGQPGEVALMAAADSYAGAERINDAYPDYVNSVTARSALEVTRFAPGRNARNIRIPLFVAICEKDTVAPAGTAQRQIARAPQAEIHLYPVHHFEIYVDEAFEKVSDDMIRFLREHVPSAASTQKKEKTK